MNLPILRICLVAPLPPPFGGIGNWTVLIRRYAGNRTDLGLDIVDTAPRWRAVDDLALWKRVIGGGLQLLRDYMAFLWRLRVHPDVVHLTSSGQLSVIRDLIIVATARALRIPSVFHIRFGRVPQIASLNTWEWRIMAKTISMAHCVIAIDPTTESAVKQRFPTVRTLRIPNGVDLSDLPAAESLSSSRTALFLGWVIPKKGVEELIQAWANLKLEGWRCVIAGPGSDKYREELRQRFHPDGLEFVPEQPHDDAMRLMAAADVFVLPSHTEGFPNVIIEAMAMGKSIISTDVGAIPEMLSGGCGVVIPSKDAAALQAALSKVLSDPVWRKDMGMRAQQKAHAEYAMDRVFEQCLTVWRKAAEPRTMQ